MSESLVVGLKIVAMFLVMSVGYACRRRGLFDSKTTSALSRFVTDITLPPLIFMQMVDTVDLPSLRVGWVIPLLACTGISIGFGLGLVTWRLFARREQAPVFIFASGISNWVYLPMPIVKELYGAGGLQTLFLCNLGLQVLFWTLGVAILHGGKLDGKALRHLLTNPGLIATLAGIGFAIARGLTGERFALIGATQPWSSVVNVVAGSARLLAEATISVSLVVTGAQIAAATLVQNKAKKALAGIMLNRLVLAPLIAIAMLMAFRACCPILSPDKLMVIAIVILMPVSVTSTVLTDKMNQDTALAAQAVLWSTLASIVMVPPLVFLAKLLIAQ